MNRLFLLFFSVTLLVFADCPAGKSWQETLQCYKILRIEAASDFFSQDALNRELLKSGTFQDLGYQAVRYIPEPVYNPNSQKPAPRVEHLALRVSRKNFTTHFTITLVDPITGRLYISDEVSSLGGHVEPKLAAVVIRWILEANGKGPGTKAQH